VHGAHDSSSCYTNILRIPNYLYKLSGKRLSGKRFVRESDCPGKVLSGKHLIRETSVRESDCPGNVRYPSHRLRGEKPQMCLCLPASGAKTKLNVGVQTFPYPVTSKPFLNSNCLMAIPCIQTLLFKA